MIVTCTSIICFTIIISLMIIKTPKTYKKYNKIKSIYDKSDDSTWTTTIYYPAKDD